jgi:hypothetical protein
MKLLILGTTILVVPLFFLFVFVMSTVGKLTRLRNRCAEVRRQNPASTEVRNIAQNYEAVRTRFPGNIVAALWGFRELEPWSESSVSAVRTGPDR